MILIGDGSRLGRLEPGDGDLLRRFFDRLSPEARYRRFLGPVVRADQVQWRTLLDVDHSDREAVCALDGGEIVGVARYARRSQTESADLAVVVADAWQRQGLATRMLAALAERAGQVGIQRFELVMLAENAAAMRLLRRLRPEARLRPDQFVYETAVAVRRSE